MIYILYISLAACHQTSSFSEFPIGNTAITVGLMARLKPDIMLLFRFEVPKDQKQ
jgi:hypothetical protein